jgi:S1-C subfamily serine protease
VVVLRRLARIVALAVPLALVACGESKTGATTASVTTRAGGAAQASDVFGRIPGIVRKVQPEVVTVLTSQGVGSGVIYRSTGIILTNDHVVSGQSAIEVAFADGRRLKG